MLYHAVPHSMRGTVLYPLNELRDRDPEAWAHERAKYDGREHVLDLTVPLLDCLWNDVLHLSPVHPRELADAFEAAGFTLDRRRFFAVDAALLGAGRTVLFRNGTDRDHRFDAEQWAWFDPRDGAVSARLPERTRDYYAECAREGRRPLLFAYVPHVLHRGTLDVRDAAVVEV